MYLSTRRIGTQDNFVPVLENFLVTRRYLLDLKYVDGLFIHALDDFSIV